MSKVRTGERRLGLSESLEDREAGIGLPEVEEVGIECLSGRGGVLERGKIETLEILLHHQTIHRGRTAQRRDLVLVDEVEDLGRMETVEVIREDARLHDPLTVVLAPHGLAPTGVGDREVNAVGPHVSQCLAVGI